MTVIIVGFIAIAVSVIFGAFEFSGWFATPWESLGYAAGTGLSIAIIAFVITVLEGETK